MKLDQLRINQLSSNAYQRYLDYLRAMDAKDLDRYADFLADTCSLQMNNDPPAKGKQAIVGMLASYWKTFNSLEHDLLNIYGTDQAYALEALNQYVRLDGQRVTVRAVAFTDADEHGKATSVRLYSDLSPVFKQ